MVSLQTKIILNLFDIAGISKMPKAKNYFSGLHENGVFDVNSVKKIFSKVRKEDMKDSFILQ